MVPRLRCFTVLASALLTASLAAAQAAGPPPAPDRLSKDQMRDFLLTAEVVKWRHIGKGVTDALKLTLSDGERTADAAFQAIDERKNTLTLRGRAGTRTEIRFVDSWRYNLAAYAVAELVGLDHMLPVVVERSHRGRKGALTWWVDVMFDDAHRLRHKIHPPDVPAWTAQLDATQLFTELIGDTDRHHGNLLITPDWRLVLIDFTRAFRVHENELLTPARLLRCRRTLLARLRALTMDDLEAATDRYLDRWEQRAVLARRDLILEHFERLVAERGERVVLY